MKKSNYRVVAIALTSLFLLSNVSAYANEEPGAWVKVDANGNAIGQAIVCTQSVCGEANSLYNQLTLGLGERYVLQAPASVGGNVAGVGAGQGADWVKVDLDTGVWSTQHTQIIVDPATKKPVIDPITEKPITIITRQEFTSNTAPWVTRVNPVIVAQEQQIVEMYKQVEKLRTGLKAKKKKVNRK
jgi:hypothetical protein